MNVIVLAAGRGSRLHPYTAECPKCLTELGDQTLIGRQLSTLRGAGIENITIVTGYRAEMLAQPNTAQIHNPDWATTNMVESLFAAESIFGDDLIVSYSDIIYEPKVIESLIQNDADISVVIDRQWRSYWEHRFSDPLSDAESLRMNDAGHIIDIGQKVENIELIEAQYIGLMRFKRAGIKALRDTRASLQHIQRPWMKKRPIEQAYMTDLLMELISRGHEISAVPIESGWLEIDTVDDFEKASKGFKDGSIKRFFNPA
mgnify:CR=1 FL=1